MSMTERLGNSFHKKMPAVGILVITILIFLFVIAGCKEPDAGASGRWHEPKEKQSREDRREQQNQKGRWVTVDRVVDGDTFITAEGERVRLIGVDTPEDTGRHEPYGREATAFAESRLAGRKVRLDYDVGRADKYGRTLAYVYFEDGMFFNALLVAEGYAQVMTVPPNVRYADRFLALQRKAREQNKGLWRAR